MTAGANQVCAQRQRRTTACATGLDIHDRGACPADPRQDLMTCGNTRIHTRAKSCIEIRSLQTAVLDSGADRSKTELSDIEVGESSERMNPDPGEVDRMVAHEDASTGSYCQLARDEPSAVVRINRPMRKGIPE